MPHIVAHIYLTFVQSWMPFVLLPQRGIVSITYQRSDIEFVRSSKVKLQAKERERKREQRKKRRLRKVLQLCFQTEQFVLLCGRFYSIPLSDNSARIHVSYFAILLLLFLRLELVSFYPVYRARVKRILCEIYGIPLLETIWCDTYYVMMCCPLSDVWIERLLI